MVRLISKHEANNSEIERISKNCTHHYREAPCGHVPALPNTYRPSLARETATTRRRMSRM